MPYSAFCYTDFCPSSISPWPLGFLSSFSWRSLSQAHSAWSYLVSGSSPYLAGVLTETLFPVWISLPNLPGQICDGWYKTNSLIILRWRLCTEGTIFLWPDSFGTVPSSSESLFLASSPANLYLRSSALWCNVIICAWWLIVFIIMTLLNNLFSDTSVSQSISSLLA